MFVEQQAGGLLAVVGVIEIPEDANMVDQVMAKAEAEATVLDEKDKSSDALQALLQEFVEAHKTVWERLKD